MRPTVLSARFVFSVVPLFVLLHVLSVRGVVLQPQDVNAPFWEPLPFASLPLVISTTAVFYQDSSVQGKVYTIGGSPYNGNHIPQATNAINELDVARERWRQMNQTGDPFTARVYHAAAVLTDPATNRSYVAVFGGFKPFNLLFTTYSVPIQDFEILDLATFSWTRKGMAVTQYIPPGVPYADYSCCSTCDSSACPPPVGGISGLVFEYERSVMYVYGGEQVTGGPSDQLWKYSLVTDQWTNMTLTNNITPARVGSAIQALSQSPKRRLVVFSGFYIVGLGTASPAVQLAPNDLWVLEEESPDTWTWTLVIPGNTFGPHARTNPLTVLVNNLFFIWGGELNATTTYYTTLLAGPMWFVNTTDNTYNTWNWTTVAMAPGQYEPPALSGAGLVYIPTQGTLTSIGGSQNMTGASTANLYRFHALGLLPPIQTILPDVPQGYDLDVDNATTCIFNGTSPRFHIRDRTPLANSVVLVSFGRLVEVNPQGGQVSLLDLRISDFVILYDLLDPSHGFKATFFTRHAVSGTGTGTTTDAVTVRFEFYQYDASVDVDALPPGSTLPAYPFPVDEGAVKFNVRINNWPFADPSNRLLLDLTLEFPAAVSTSASATSYGTSHSFVTNTSRVSVNVLGESVNDLNTPAAVITNITTTGNSVAMQFSFQSFASSLFYDPSVGILVTPADSSSGGGGGGGSDNTAIYVGVFVSVGVAAIVVILAIVVGGAALWYTRHLRTSRKMAMLKEMSAVTEEMVPD